MYGFTTDFQIHAKIGQPLSFSTKVEESDDDMVFHTKDDLLRYLDDANGRADMEDRHIPYREVVIIEVNPFGERIGDMAEYYEYEPYTAQERRAYNERP